MIENTTQRRIRPLPAGSHLVQFSKGKHVGKFGVFGLEGIQNSLKRFAGIPLFVVVERSEENSGSVFDNEEEAIEWATDPMYRTRYIVKKIVLTAEQIVR